jgi:PEP-CTERM motif
MGGTPVKKKSTSEFAWAALGLAIGVAVSSARADMVIWDIDPAQSFVRLTIPDQAITLNGTAATIRLRDNNSTSVWTDDGGRRAFVDGTLKTNYVDGSSIEFLSGMHNIFALEGANVRPDPAQFTGPSDAANPDGTYVGTDAAAAAYGARVRASVSIFTVDAGYLALRNVLYDVSSGVVPLGGGGTTISGNTSNFGISSARVDVDGLLISLISSQPIPDVFNASLPPVTGVETAAGSIADLGAGARRLTYNISVPINVEISGVVLTGTADGQIVAFATVPEPSTLVLAGFGLVALAGRLLRKRTAA